MKKERKIKKNGIENFKISGYESQLFFNKNSIRIIIDISCAASRRAQHEWYVIVFGIKRYYHYNHLFLKEMSVRPSKEDVKSPSTNWTYAPAYKAALYYMARLKE